MTEDPYEQDPYEQDPYENELRVLLERTVPQIPAPTDRLMSVRNRVARRRTRRAAGAAACAVAAVALTITLLPTGPTAVLPAAPPTRPPTPAYGAVHFPGLGGLALPLPAGWQSGTAGGLPVAASQPLPVRTLRSGNGLLTLTAINSGLQKKVRNPPLLSDMSTLSKACRLLGGTREYYGLVGSPAAAKVVEVDLCVSAGSARLVAEVRAAVAQAVFPAPTEMPTLGNTPEAAR
ncbi:hypothetical protein [Streptomyces sp. NPDC050738]|uniref:hypothetical protein n=1 Tax=Streptomyces sp. NPDC050738 TaxID=3154744 RepID=UPI0034499467